MYGITRSLGDKFQITHDKLSDNFVKQSLEENNRTLTEINKIFETIE